jgi:hypothetical protein
VLWGEKEVSSPSQEHTHPRSRSLGKERRGFFHTKRFQYNAKPDAPDPIFAKLGPPKGLD